MVDRNHGQRAIGVDSQAIDRPAAAGLAELDVNDTRAKVDRKTGNVIERGSVSCRVEAIRK